MADAFHKKLLEKLDAARGQDPVERFDRMVASGLINRQGQLTKGHGGEAEPERDVDSDHPRLSGQ